MNIVTMKAIIQWRYKKDVLKLLKKNFEEDIHPGGLQWSLQSLVVGLKSEAHGYEINIL